MQRVKCFLEVIFATAIPHCCHIINVRFYVSIVEDFSGIDVNNNYVAVKKERKKLLLFFDMVLLVLDPSKFVVNNKT